MGMLNKVAKKAQASVPRMINGRKGEGKTGGVSRAVLKKKVETGKLAAKAAAATPACVNKNKAGGIAKKAAASVPKCVDPSTQAGGKTTLSHKDISQQPNIHTGRAYIKELEARRENLERGVVQKGILRSTLETCGTCVDNFLQVRKAAVEKFPLYFWRDNIKKQTYSAVKEAVITNSDRFGNYIYNKDWGLASDFVGGLFHASDMEENAGIGTAIGSFYNGFYKSAFETVDGIASMAIDPYETIENLNHAVMNPKETVQGAVKEVKRIWNEEVVNGSTEDRSRLAGSAAFEIVMALMGIEEAKAAKAAKGAKAGDKAADLGKAAKAADAVDDVGDVSIAAKRVNRMEQMMDTASDIKDASRGAAGSLKTRVSGMLNRALTSDAAKKMMDRLDDLERDIRKYLDFNGLEGRLVPETGIIDDVDRVGTSRKVYEKLLKSTDRPVSDSGIKIRKAEIIEDAGDLVDDVGEYGKVVGIREKGKTIDYFSDDALKHASEGEFTYNPRTGEISKIKGGGHGQENLDLLDSLGIEYNIEKTYPNGVRIGNIPSHKMKLKRGGTGQSWFPKDWDSQKIKEAGNYVIQANQGISIIDGEAIFAEYDGVLV